jgi:hypothetical protein
MMGATAWVELGRGPRGNGMGRIVHEPGHPLVGLRIDDLMIVLHAQDDRLLVEHHVRQ